MDDHLSDRELLMAMDGELEARDAARAEEHLAACWTCRARKLDLERAIADFVHLHRSIDVPSATAPRALLKAHLAEAAAANRASSWSGRWLSLAAVASTLVIAGIAVTLWMPGPRVVRAAPLVPNPSLTPGAAVLISRSQVCRESQPNNKEVPVALRKRVLEEYGLQRSEGRAFEVDYLITPALGGADDIHNIWPQPYGDAQWNARVKDALEERLRMMVCDGEVDLQTAQREIASNWIEAYKKYFGTDHPVEYGRP